jgi:hypothetical protein
MAVGFRFVNPRSSVVMTESWNGGAWRIQPTPTPGRARSSELVDVACVSRRFCLAVGSFTERRGQVLALVERWNGARWSRVPAPDGVSASGVSCTSASACVVAGGGPYSDGLAQYFSGGTAVARWGGFGLSRQPTPRIGPGGLSAVSCTSLRACVAVGYGPRRDGYGTLAERWNGMRWSVQRTPTPGGLEDWLWGISCPSTVACTAVGGFVTDSSNDTLPVVERWNGRRWSMQPTASLPPSPGVLLSFGTLSHVSCASPNACVAVGSLNPPDNAGARTMLAERSDGARWTIQATETPAAATTSELNGVSCTSRIICVAVGSFSNSANKLATLVERYP